MRFSNVFAANGEGTSNIAGNKGADFRKSTVAKGMDYNAIDSDLHMDYSDNDVNKGMNNRLTVQKGTSYNAKAVNDLRLRHIDDIYTSTDYKTSENKYNKEFPYRKSTIYNMDYSSLSTSWCVVPKVGCTFLTEMFWFLTDKNMTDQNLCNSRAKVHSHMMFSRNVRTVYPTMIAVRDPYLRLYSAYIDKIYLTSFLTIDVRKKYVKAMAKENASESKVRTVMCTNDVTFQEFLDVIVWTARSATSTLNQHWVPIPTLCRHCLLNKNMNMLIKQESFSQDVSYFLQKIGASDDERDVINRKMTDNRIETNMYWIIQSMWIRRVEDKCMTKGIVVKRLWTTFQIQGFIDEHIVYPEEAISEALRQSKGVEYFHEFMVKAAKESNLTRHESRLQRNEYFLRAYQGISPETVKDIKSIYYFNFLLFEYSMDPPKKVKS